MGYRAIYYRKFRLFLLFAAVVGFFSFTITLHARDIVLSTILWKDLPKDAKETLSLIKKGGPFPYPQKDGNTFGNFEKRLPKKPYGFYKEYTVPTPSKKNRGKKRIVVGKSSHPNNDTPTIYYYTHDHYRTFRWIKEP